MNLDKQMACDKELFWDALKAVVDPEIGLNIVDLGMVYGIELEPKEDHTYHVQITMTFTSPTCPMADLLLQETKTAITRLKLCHDLEINITFDPPWHRDMITEEGRMHLGWL